MTDSTANTLLPLTLAIAGCGLGVAALCVPRLRHSRLPALLLLIGSPLLGGLWWASRSLGGPEASKSDRGEYRIALTPVGQPTAFTDRGRPVRVAVLGRPVPAEVLSENESERVEEHDLSRKVIARTEPDPAHNCHGWVFTGGLFWVPGDDVHRILADNGYRRVTAPQVGDLAVYRDAAGDITHSGVVFSTAGGTLVESKWGPLGRFLHGPDDQPFGGECGFYRSPRSGHLLDGILPKAE
jgi:hypothetical protein